MNSNMDDSDEEFDQLGSAADSELEKVRKGRKECIIYTHRVHDETLYLNLLQVCSFRTQCNTCPIKNLRPSYKSLCPVPPTPY